VKSASGNRVPWQDILTAGFPKFELRGTPQETQTFGKGDGRTVWWRLFEGCRYPNWLVSSNEFEMHVSIYRFTMCYIVVHPWTPNQETFATCIHGVQSDQCGCAIGNWSTKMERLQPAKTWGRLVAKKLTIILLELTMSIPSIYMYLRQTWSIVLLMNSFGSLTCTTSPISWFFLEQADGF
jgi:hypothetical protein